ncbi:MAG: adenylyltransferase/cytidyltransferase family protein [Gemmatimonadales bacterium]|nr:adenylyltransferase/cytidyltransferase family protein [Gemmatimonadales bacterium]
MEVQPEGRGTALSTEDTTAKVRSADEAVAWRDGAPGPVVFTNGVFDLLHVGHVAVLEAAAGFGGSLVVGVNDDASAARLGKGPDRPVVPAVDRARVIAALACVDCVVLFDDDTPLRLVEALQPDVIVKGGDYTPDSVVGAEVVRQRGGRVEIVPIIAGHSTTRIVERLRGTS